MNDMRLEAYYYSFEPTGCGAIDHILSAVACAGKAFHHTESWSDETEPWQDFTGATPADWIQNAANDAAHLLVVTRCEWTCGCGTVNGVNLSTCRVCGRKEGEP